MTRKSNMTKQEAVEQLNAIALMNTAVNNYYSILQEQGYDAERFAGPVFDSYKESVNFIGQHSEWSKLRYSSQAGTVKDLTYDAKWEMSSE
jgi:hypothetical protein|tara:strand:- start:154 stop:426 length:273 start_codon:yes stop_codon:yes gene_type:complete